MMALACALWLAVLPLVVSAAVLAGCRAGGLE